MIKSLSILISFAATVSFADGIEDHVDEYLVSKENSLQAALLDLRAAKTDEDLQEANQKFIEELEEVLEYPGVMDYEFSKLESMSTIKSPDGEFRIFNWNIENSNLVHSHYCYVVRPGKGGRKNQVIELKEDKITLPPRPEQVLGSNQWYGALYYNIIPVKKGSKTIYTMLGYNGNDRSTNRKILDAFYFKGKNLRMGYPIFQESEGSSVLKKRVFLEYSDKATVTLNMNHNLGAIVFDHLIPEQANLEGMYDYYIPDMTYDGYRWKNGMWSYVDDVVAYNDPNKKVKQYIPAKDGEGEDKVVEVKDEWIDPVDPNLPNPNGYDATAPIEKVDDKKQPADVQTSEPKKEKEKFKLFKWRSKTHSAIGDSKAEKKQNRRRKKLK